MPRTGLVAYRRLTEQPLRPDAEDGGTASFLLMLFMGSAVIALGLTLALTSGGLRLG